MVTNKRAWVKLAGVEKTPPATPPNPSERPKPNLRLIRKMRVARIADYTPQIRELFLECSEPNEFDFRAGQFIMLHVPPEGAVTDPPTKPALRAYSIASTEHVRNGYRLVFKYVENGIASKYVWSLNEGESVDFTGPFGRVFFHEPPTEQQIFLNTGSGISQHFSFIESNIEKFPDLKYRLLFGVRTEADVYYREELERLKSQLKDFKYEFVLSRASDSWQGLRGYVQNHIDAFEFTKTPSTFYLCGNGAMIKDVKTKLNGAGFDPKMIFAEAFD